MKFEWNKELETGIPALDSQHKGIFDRIINFFQKCDEGEEAKEIIELFDFLDSYTKKHFIYEENLQKYNNYPGLAEQQEQHALFLADLAELRRTLETAGQTRDLSLITKGKLIRWYNHHIKNLDKRFADFLKAKQS
ncbi:MAG: bacteriohemerythrin [Desulfuromonadaceae bacterium]